MLVRDIFTVNDWDIRSALILAISLKLAFLGSVILDILGIPLPIIRPATGFLILTFIPGMLVLRVLRIHHIGALKTLVYSVGFSLAILMFTGFFINTLYPFYGIFRPISLRPLVFTTSAVIVLLATLAYIRDRNFSSPGYLHLRDILSPPVLALSLLPFGAIAGTYFMNFYGMNGPLMVLLPVVALVPVVVACTPYIPEKYYPYAVFSVTLTLLYHTALISMYIWGWDIQYEYHLANTVIQNGFWDPNAYSTCNAMLSVNILSTFYSIVLGLGLDWVFKIIYPFLFSLVPLGLYAVFRPRTSGKTAFLACFFFASLFGYYNEMLAVPRQQVAELFLVLIILSMADYNLTRLQRAFSFVVFSMSLVVSHYGLSYIFIFILLIAWTLATLGNRVNIQRYAEGILAWVRSKSPLLSVLSLQKFIFPRKVIPFSFILCYGVFVLGWYIYTSSSASFDTLVTIAHGITTHLSSDLLDPDAVQGAAIIADSALTPLYMLAKYLHLLMIFFIVVGFIVSVFHQRWAKFDLLYLLLAFGALCICVGGVTLPFFASAFNTSRLYHISLILLAPFCAVGGLALISKIKYIFRRPDRSLQILSILFGVYLLLNCGWIFELGHENTSNFALNSSVDSTTYSLVEVQGVEWLINSKDDGILYADRYRDLNFYRVSGPNSTRLYPRDESTMVHPSYLYFGTFNVLSGKLIRYDRWAMIIDYTYCSIRPYVYKSDKVYDGGGSMVFYNAGIPIRSRYNACL
jgi:uncharacterized membrane protein